MKKIKGFVSLSGTRKGWAVSLAIPFLALATAMYVQYGLGYKPCFYCIHERLVFVSFAVLSILGVLIGNIPAIATILTFCWVVVSQFGLKLALTHTDLQIHPSIFDQCAMFIRYPSWLPLDKWLPSMFTVQAECSANIVRFWGLVIPEWLVIVFSISFVVSLVVLIGRLSLLFRVRN